MISIVTTRSFELIRDRIAEILANELPNQATLHVDANLNAPVFIDRIVPLHDEELPLVNVLMASGTYNSFTQTKQDGTYTFNVDIYVGSASSSIEDADVLSMRKLQKLSGVIQGILMHPNYVTLGFARPFIEHREVANISTGIPNNNLDASSVTQARLELVVRVPETSVPMVPNDIEGWQTQVFMGLTDKGYIYSGDNIPIPTPVCSPVTINKSDGTLIASAASGSTYAVADSAISVNGDFFSNVLATHPENIRVVNESDVEIGVITGGEVLIYDFPLYNSSGSFNIFLPVDKNGYGLSDIDNIDSDGTVVTTPAQTPFVCTPPDDTLIAYFDSFDLASINDGSPVDNDLVSNVGSRKTYLNYSQVNGSFAPRIEGIVAGSPRIATSTLQYMNLPLPVVFQEDEAFSVYYVVSLNSDSGSNGFVVNTAVSNTLADYFWIRPSVPYLRCNNGANVDFNRVRPVVIDVPEVFSFHRDTSNNFTVYQNGVLLTGSSATFPREMIFRAFGVSSAIYPGHNQYHASLYNVHHNPTTIATKTLEIRNKYNIPL